MNQTRNYDIGDFEPFEARGRALALNGARVAYERQPFDGQLSARVEAILKRDPAVRERFERGKPADHPEWSQSEIDASLACQLASRGCTGSEIETALRISRARAGVPDGHKGKDYYTRTVESALGLVDELDNGPGGDSGQSDDPPTEPPPGVEQARKPERERAHEQAAPHQEPEPEDEQAPPPPGTEHLTDLGNAQRLVRLHGGDLHFVHLWNKWLIWNQRAWPPDETGEIVRRAKETVQSIYAEAGAASKLAVRRAIAAHARASEAVAKIRAMISLAESEPGIPVRHEDLDSDPMLLCVANGVIELRTGRLRPHSRADLITKMVPVAFDPKAQAPLWYAFLEQIIPIERVRDFLWRAIGYALTGLTIEQVLFVLWGGGANGKTTFVETIRTLLGDYALHTPADTLLAKRDTGIPNDVARLRGARFVSAAETEDGRRLAEVQVKMLTGSDTISARFMRAEWFDFRPVAKIFLATNHKPGVRGTDHAIWRRIRLVPFTVTIPAEEQDRQLADKLRAELPGILAWAVRGCLAWQTDGLQPPPEVLAATEQYRHEEDVLGQFLEDECVIDPGAHAFAGLLFTAYCEWAKQSGLRDKDVLTQTAFGRRLAERGFAQDRETGGKRRRFWSGLRLLSSEESQS